MSVNDRQVGGDHYASKSVQHWDVIVDCFGIGYLIGCATKYVARHDKKNGEQDLLKAEHYLEKIIERVLAGDSIPTVGNTTSLLGFLDILKPSESLVCDTIMNATKIDDFYTAARCLRTLKRVRYG